MFEIPEQGNPFERGRVYIGTIHAEIGPGDVKRTEEAVQALIDADPDFDQLSLEEQAARFSDFYDQVGSYNNPFRKS